MPQKIALITVAAAVLAGGLYVGLSNDDGTPDGPSATMELTVEDNGSSITLSTGDTFTVRLAGNPTTGYGWESAATDESVVQMVGEPAYEPDSEELIGSGGVYTFTFEVIGSGETELTLVYRRSWEDDVDPLETFTVQVDVA